MNQYERLRPVALMEMVMTGFDLPTYDPAGLQPWLELHDTLKAESEKGLAPIDDEVMKYVIKIYLACEIHKTFNEDLT